LLRAALDEISACIDQFDMDAPVLHGLGAMGDLQQLARGGLGRSGEAQQKAATGLRTATASRCGHDTQPATSVAVCSKEFVAAGVIVKLARAALCGG